uniref:peptidyl-tRNA hydrolase n=1 Tax=Lepeophtheirus salmonis TaxID=72036 RepID=D3PGK2_LEPSM|nr:protein C2orf79 homolog [Lepeophtheirus salmonis]
MATSSLLVQYIIIREDLVRSLAWPLGAVIAQGCHACVAVIHEFYHDEDTVKYLRDIDNMRKVVLKIKDEETLSALSKKLNDNEIKHKLWTEQPENYPTCIALKPYEKSRVHPFLKHLRLCDIKI